MSVDYEIKKIAKDYKNNRDGCDYDYQSYQDVVVSKFRDILNIYSSDDLRSIFNPSNFRRISENRMFREFVWYVLSGAVQAIPERKRPISVRTYPGDFWAAHSHGIKMPDSAKEYFLAAYEFVQHDRLLGDSHRLLCLSGVSAIRGVPSKRQARTKQDRLMQGYGRRHGFFIDHKSLAAYWREKDQPFAEVHRELMDKLIAQNAMSDRSYIYGVLNKLDRVIRKNPTEITDIEVGENSIAGIHHGSPLFEFQREGCSLWISDEEGTTKEDNSSLYCSCPSPALANRQAGGVEYLYCKTCKKEKI